MTGRYVYEHPAEAGFGEHHADPSHPLLAERSAERHGAAGAPQHPAMPGEITMADLDLKHGTVVTLAADGDPESPGFGGVARDAGNDAEIVEWTDSQGTPRRTAVSPEFFAAHFREVTP